MTMAKWAMAWKRAMVRAARAMAMATRVAGDKEGEGIKECDEDKVRRDRWGQQPEQ